MSARSICYARLLPCAVHARKLEAGTRVVTACRASTLEQAPSLQEQVELLDAEVAALGLIKLEGFQHCGSGQSVDWLEEVIVEAKELGCRHIVAESVDRLARNENYSKFNQKNTTNTHKLSQLQFRHEVRFATIQHPETPYEEVRSYQSQRKQRIKELRPPGYKKRIRDLWQLRAVEMRILQGISYERIADQISQQSGYPVSHGTVYKWVQAHLKECGPLRSVLDGEDSLETL